MKADVHFFSMNFVLQPFNVFSAHSRPASIKGGQIKSSLGSPVYLQLSTKTGLPHMGQSQFQTQW